MKTLMKENCTTEKQNTNTVRIHKQDRSLRMLLGQAGENGGGAMIARLNSHRAQEFGAKLFLSLLYHNV